MADGKRESVNADTILDAAARLIELHGVGAFTMRSLPRRLGSRSPRSTGTSAAGTRCSTAWSRDCSARWRTCPSWAGTRGSHCLPCPLQRRVLIERQHLLSIAHERDRTPALFLPVQQTLAAQLAELGVTGDDAALVLRAIQVHVISSAVMQFSAVRGAKHDEEDPSLWTDDWPDRELVEALQSPTDYDAVFDYGLDALLAPLRAGGSAAGR